MFSGKENGLDDEYLIRRENLKSRDTNLLSFLDRAYNRIINGKALDGIPGIVKYKAEADFSDYDFSGVSELPGRLIQSKMDFSNNTGFELVHKCFDKFIIKLEDSQQKNIFSDFYFKHLEYKFLRNLENIPDYEGWSSDNADACRDIITKLLEFDEIDIDKILKLHEKTWKLEGIKYNLHYDDNFLNDIFENKKISDERKKEVVKKMLSIDFKHLTNNENVLKQILKYAEEISEYNLNLIFSAIIEIDKDCINYSYEEKHFDWSEIVNVLAQNKKINNHQKNEIIDKMIENGDPQSKSFIEAIKNEIYLTENDLSTLSVNDFFENENNRKFIDLFITTQKDRLSGKDYSDIISRITDSKEIDPSDKDKIIETCISDGKDKFNSFNYNNIIKTIMSCDDLENYRKIELIQQCILDGIENTDESKKLLEALVKKIIKDEQNKNDEKESSKTLNKLLKNPEKNIFVSYLFIKNGVDLTKDNEVDYEKIINSILENENFDFKDKVNILNIFLEKIKKARGNNDLSENDLSNIIDNIPNFIEVDFDKTKDIVMYGLESDNLLNYDKEIHFKALSSLLNVTEEEKKCQIYNDWLDVFEIKFGRVDSIGFRYYFNIIESIELSDKLDDNQKIELYQEIIERTNKERINIDWEDFGNKIVNLKNADESKKLEIYKKYLSKKDCFMCISILNDVLDFEEIDNDEKMPIIEEFMALGEKYSKHSGSYHIGKSREIYEILTRRIFELDNIPEEKKVEILTKSLENVKNFLSGNTYSEIISEVLDLEETDSSKKIELIRNCLKNGFYKFDNFDYVNIMSKILENGDLENRNLELFEETLENGKNEITGSGYCEIIGELLDCESIENTDKLIQIEKCLEYGDDKFQENDYQILTNIILNSKFLNEDKLKIVEELVDNKCRKIEDINQAIKGSSNLRYEEIVREQAKVLKAINDSSRIDENEKSLLLNKLIKNIIDVENGTNIKQGKNTVNASGVFLNYLLDNPDENKDLILMFINNGTNLNFIQYKNENNNPTYIPTLYKAMKIEDDELRKYIVGMMVEYGVKTDVEYKSIDYNEAISKKTKISVLKMNNYELKQIIEEKKNENSLKNKSKINADTSKKESSNVSSIEEFLSTVVNLSKDEIMKLSELYSSFGRDLFEESIEGFKTKKMILDVCNATHEGFSKFGNILFNPVNVLYSRLMFFEENGIKIQPQKLDETIGATKKSFAKKYGKKLGISDTNRLEYAEEVKRELLKRYPMPHNREKMIENVEQIAKKDEVCL